MLFDKKIAEASRISSHTGEIVVAAKEYTLRGGKRLRPIFCIYGYQCLSDTNIDAIVKASISLELMQSYLLIHDDIMDEDELRRGKTTFHIICKDLCEREFGTTKSLKFGESIAIVAGDLLEAYGEEIVANSPFNSEYVRKALAKYAAIVENVGYGQILDITAERKGGFNEDEILTIHKLKTASYTIEGPLHIGALLAGANEADLQILSDYGIPLGLAFQIHDDILGLFGSEEKTGKPVGSDVQEGKKTLLILHALKSCTGDEKAFIFNALGNEQITAADVDKVREIVRRTGSLEYSKRLVTEMTDKAVQAIKTSDFRAEAKEFLINIADFIGNREY
ncbi:MAG: polyprenyl synthetase family protein [Methanomicrobia archaeon]|nr:polyprenyl synthetase family protein [Methanomicrobia archaeon]